MSIPHPKKRKIIQKKATEILVDKQQQQQQQQETEFTVVSLDESFFFYDSLVRRVWIEQKKRPIVRVTGSHKNSCIFGAIVWKENSYSDSMIDLMAIHFLFSKDNSF